VEEKRKEREKERGREVGKFSKPVAYCEVSRR